MDFVYDDGSTLSTNSAGEVTSARDINGASVPVSDPAGGITQQFFDMVAYGVQRVLDNRLPPAPALRTGVQATAAAPMTLQSALGSPLVRVGLLGLGAFFLWKKFG